MGMFIVISRDACLKAPRLEILLTNSAHKYLDTKKTVEDREIIQLADAIAKCLFAM